MESRTPSAVYYVRSSSNPAVFYEVALNPRGFWECSCPSATYRRDRPRKHQEQVVRGCGLRARAKTPQVVGQLSDLYRAVA